MLTMEQIGFTKPLAERLAQIGVVTTDDAMMKSDEELLAVRGMGVQRLELIRISTGQKPPIHVKESTETDVPIVEDNTAIVFTDHLGNRFQARSVEQDKETGAMTLFYYGQTAAIRTVQHRIPYKLPGEKWGWCLLDGNYNQAATGAE